VAIAPDGSGAVAWMGLQGDHPGPWVRVFDAEGRIFGPETEVQRPPQSSEPLEGPAAGRGVSRGGAEAGPDSPVLLARADGTRIAAWIAGGRAWAARIEAGAAEVAASPLGPAGTEPEPGLWVASLGDGFALAWNGSAGAHFAARAGGAERSAQLTGRVHGLVADGAGGLWIALARDGGAWLAHLDGELRRDRAEVRVVEGTVAAVELAAFASGLSASGLALLVTRDTAPATERGGGRGTAPGPERGTGASPERGGGTERGESTGGRGARSASADPEAVHELALFDSSGRARAAPFAVFSADARVYGAPRLASDGARLLVGWTDLRAGDPDVWVRPVDPAAEAERRLGAERRVNGDLASADQLRADVDAEDGRGLAVWQDRRAPNSRIFARAFGERALSGGEFALPLAAAGTPAAEPPGGAALSGGAALPGGAERPRVALRPGGSALVVWVQRERERARLLGQVVTLEGAAGSAVIELDAREDGSLGHAAVCALSGERGWLAAWPRGRSEGVWSRRIAPDGTAEGALRRLSEPREAEVSDVEVAELDGGRTIAAWSSHRLDAPREQGWSVRARLLDVSGAPRGAELDFESGRSPEAWDPAIAPARGGGFLMAWCSGPPTDATRDVCVRLFDERGKPDGPLLTPCYLANEQDFPDVARLPDGSFAIVWEDDVSYYDHVYLRRVLANGRGLGPWVRINELETKFVPDRVEPRVAAIGKGLALVFSDRRRSQGLDVRLKLVGPAFDRPAGR
jgi:hypothetical protein